MTPVPAAIAIVLAVCAAACGHRASSASSESTMPMVSVVQPTAATALAPGRDFEAVITAQRDVALAASESTDDGGGGESTPVAAQAPVPAPGAVQVATAPDPLVVEAWLKVEVEDVVAAVDDLRGRVIAAGGRVVTEQIDAAEHATRANLSIRLPPDKLDAVLTALDGRGEILSKQVQATDVGKTLFDQGLAIDNLRLTLDRLRKLYERPDLQTAQILEVERELTRVRGEIEMLEGQRRFLRDRVALATLTVELVREADRTATLSPTVKVYPGPRLAWLHRFRAGDADGDRVGGGVTLHLGVPRLSLELDVFGDPDGVGPEEASAIATFGGAFYSELLGRGKRRWLNPYIGFRAGYGYLGASSFVAQAELGVELFKARYVMIDASVRPTAFFGDEFESGLVGGASAVVAF